MIEEDLANVEFETSEDVDVVPTFDSMGLREDLLRGIYAYGNIDLPLKKFVKLSFAKAKPLDSVLMDFFSVL